MNECNRNSTSWVGIKRIYVAPNVELLEEVEYFIFLMSKITGQT